MAHHHPGTPRHELGALPSERPCGEDHRDGHPGYDLDEQAVYGDVLRRRGVEDHGSGEPHDGS